MFEYLEFVGAMVIDMFGQNETCESKQYFCGATAFDISLLFIYTMRRKAYPLKAMPLFQPTLVLLWLHVFVPPSDVRREKSTDFLPASLPTKSRSF